MAWWRPAEVLLPGQPQQVMKRRVQVPVAVQAAEGEEAGEAEEQ